MAQGLSKTAKRRVETIMAHLVEILKSASAIEESAVRELVRRASISVTPDGFPSNSMPEHQSGSGTGSSSVETAAAAREEPRGDSVQRDLRRLERGLAKAESLLRDSTGVLTEVDREIEEKRERVVTNPCSICLELPAVKSGWCDPDYSDWWKHGKPDRLRWEMYKRGDQTKDDVTGMNVLMVPECPPPSNGNVAIRGPWRGGAEDLS